MKSPIDSNNRINLRIARATYKSMVKADELWSAALHRGGK